MALPNGRGIFAMLLSLWLLISAPVLAIWPAPSSIKTGESTLWINSDIAVTYNGKFGGVSRAIDNIVHKNFVPWMLYNRMELESTEPNLGKPKTYVSHLDITQTRPDKTFKPEAGEVDESYTLKVNQNGKATITAASSTGVLHALESFSQLFFQHSKGQYFYTQLAPVSITDSPEYVHRGVLFDVSRSFFPIDSILRTIDALAYNKMNRIHIHATDSQSWPLEIPSLPELHEKGAYAQGKTYSPSELDQIQRYAINRGVQPIVEIDTPGHFGIAALSHPEVVAGWNSNPWTAYCAEPPCGQIRLKEPKVDPFLDTLMDDILPRVAPYTPYFHTGGDEVNFNMYTLDPQVATNDSAVIVPLLQKFIDKHHARVRKAGLIPMVWEEIPASYNVTVGKDVIIQSWLGDEAIADLTAKGHKVISSNYNYWYLDCGRGQWLNFGPDQLASFYPFPDWCSPYKNWRLGYSYDPRANLTAAQAKLVLGGELAAWSESIDDATIDDILWPRASAAGEVLWSSPKGREQIEAAPRLAVFREQLVARGIKAGTVHMPFCTQGLNSTACHRIDRCVLEQALERASTQSVFFSLVVIFALWRIFVHVYESIRLRRLGARAPRAVSRLPFGLGIAASQVRATLRHKNMESFLSILKPSTNYNVEAKILGRRVIFTADPENIKAILATQFADYGKGEPFHREWKDFLGDSIFATDGQSWHDSRQLLRPQFSRERVSDLHTFESHLQTLFKAIANGGALDGPYQHVDIEAGNGRPLEISDLFYRYTLDVSTSFLLGKDVQSLTNPHEQFAQAFNEVQRIQSIGARAGPLKFLVPRGSFRRGLKVVNGLCDVYIDRALQMSQEELASKTKSDHDYTFLHELAQFTRDRTVLRDQLRAVLLAGRDTTAATLSWTLYELGRHPEVVRKLRDEILSTVGPNRRPTYGDLKSMKYLQSVVNETLRLYPAVPFNVRLALRDTTLPRGGGPDGMQPIAVLKDNPVGYSPLVMQRRPDLYPIASEKFAHPSEYSPDRWLVWQPRPWQYIPFNGGPRICIGQQFALTEITYVLTRMFQRFDRVESFMDDIDGGTPKLRSEIVISPGDGVKVALWEARQL
ncbi:glycoside hydrolase family 20 protein [Nemania sp. FL0916]|nr:glycoside hydrolase family 20 protein [Nemania sp. FL0916]